MERCVDQKLTIGTSGTGEGFAVGLGGAVGVAAGDASGAGEGVAEGVAEGLIVSEGMAATPTGNALGVAAPPPMPGRSAAAVATTTNATTGRPASRAGRRNRGRRVIFEA